MILHDPQTAGLIPHVRALGVTVVWRCHIGVDAADETTLQARGFLERLRQPGRRDRVLP